MLKSLMLLMLMSRHRWTILLALAFLLVEPLTLGPDVGKVSAQTDFGDIKLRKPRGKNHGVACDVDKGCLSRACRPGPMLNGKDSSAKYCLASGMNCAWPNTRGSKLKQIQLVRGKIYICSNRNEQANRFLFASNQEAANVIADGAIGEKYFYNKLSGGVGHERDCKPREQCRHCLLRNIKGGCIKKGNDPICELRKVAKRKGCEGLKSTEIAQALPLSNAIIESRKSAVRAGIKNIPPVIRDQLSPYFSKSLLDTVRYRKGSKGVLDVQRIPFMTGSKAVTLNNVIVFSKNQYADDVCIWAHEIEHVIQYKYLGTARFAERYVQPAKRGNYNPENTGSLEGSAETRSEFVCTQIDGQNR